MAGLTKAYPASSVCDQPSGYLIDSVSECVSTTDFASKTDRDPALFPELSSDVDTPRQPPCGMVSTLGDHPKKT